MLEEDSLKNRALRRDPKKKREQKKYFVLKLMDSFFQNELFALKLKIQPRVKLIPYSIWNNE